MALALHSGGTRYWAWCTLGVFSLLSTSRSVGLPVSSLLQTNYQENLKLKYEFQARGESRVGVNLFWFWFFSQIVAIGDNEEQPDTSSDCCSVLLTIISIILIILTFPISIFFCIRIVPEYERAILFRLGRLTSETSSRIETNSGLLDWRREGLQDQDCSSSFPALTRWRWWTSGPSLSTCLHRRFWPRTRSQCKVKGSET